MTSKSKQLHNGKRMSLVEDREKTVLRQCVQARSQLETAIAGVARAEAALKDNSREVKSQLHSCISRHLEFLRSREVWLLEQIDIVHQLKEETLHQQLQQLHWLRGQFDILIHQLEKSSHSHDLANQITSCLEKLSSLSLKPEETPEMSFQADACALRQAITSFGTIATQGMEAPSSGPQKSLGPVRSWLQQSCPLAAKKPRVEPEWGVVLADWLVGSQPSSSGPIAYQASKNPQDWLASSGERVQVSCPLVPFDFHKAWGQLKDLEAWLIREKSPARERTMSNASTASTFSIEKIDESEFTLSAEDEEEVEVEEEEMEKGQMEEGEEESLQTEEEVSGWLVTPPPPDGDKKRDDADRWKRVFRPFQEGFRSSDWLSKSDCGSCCATRVKAVEIENLGQLKCLKQSPPTSPVSSNPAPIPALEAWLAKQPLPLPVAVQQVCKANETCGSFSQCVCEENCGREALRDWLYQQEGRDKNGVASKGGAKPSTTQQQRVEAILEAWLHPARGGSSSPAPLGSAPLSSWVSPAARGEKGEEPEKAQPRSPFLRPLRSDSWVLPAKKHSPPADLPAPAEEDKWLLRKRAQTQERYGLPTVCDLFACMKLGGDKEKWLHKAPIQM